VLGVVDVDRSRPGINHPVEWLTRQARARCTTPSGAIATADFLLLRELAGDLFPVKDDVRISPAYITLVLGINYIVSYGYA
jgi:hypothetical protein